MGCQGACPGAGQATCQPSAITDVVRIPSTPLCSQARHNYCPAGVPSISVLNTGLLSDLPPFFVLGAKEGVKVGGCTSLNFHALTGNRFFELGLGQHCIHSARELIDDSLIH